MVETSLSGSTSRWSDETRHNGQRMSYGHEVRNGKFASVGKQVPVLQGRLVECAPIVGALVHNEPLSAFFSAQCALSAPKAPVVAPINYQVAPSFSDVLNCVSW